MGPIRPGPEQKARPVRGRRSERRHANSLCALYPHNSSIKRRSHCRGSIGFWGITPFEGNLYISRKYLKTHYLRPNWVPGLCIYKFLFVWLDLRLPNGTWEPFVGWMYWLPNPLLPFIAFRPAVPRLSPALQVEEIIA